MDDNGLNALVDALAELDKINAHVVALRGLGRTRAAVGAENSWLDGAVRIAVTPAPTREAAEVKIMLLAVNMYGWAIHASQANGVAGATGLIMGALNAEAHDHGIAVPGSFEDFDLNSPPTGVAHPPGDVKATLDADVEAAYRKAAKRRRLGPALRRFERLGSKVAARAARGETHELAEAIAEARLALLDALAVPAGDLAELQRKQAAFIGHIDHADLPEEDVWLFENGFSVCYMLDIKRLGLSPAKVARLKAKFPSVWTSVDRPGRGKA